MKQHEGGKHTAGIREENPVFSTVWGRLPRALDETGRQNAVRSRPRSPRMVVIAKGGGPYSAKQIGAGDRGGLRGTAATPPWPFVEA